MAAGVFVGPGGLLSSAITAGEWVFTTEPDSVGPNVVALFPVPGDRSVPTLQPNITMVFDEPVAVGRGSVRVFATVGTINTESVDVTAENAVEIAGNTAIINLSPQALTEDVTGYHVRVTAGAFTDTSQRANP